MNSRAYPRITDAIGNTPLVRLHRITHGLESEIWAKLEFMNPMGSIKDRTALHMIEAAERKGLIKDGQLIIESSSDNTALGLALVAAQNVRSQDRIGEIGGLSRWFGTGRIDPLRPRGLPGSETAE